MSRLAGTVAVERSEERRVNRYAQVLVGVDGGAASFEAAERALDIAAACGAELHVVDVVPNPAITAPLGAAGAVAVSHHVARSDATASVALERVRQRADELKVNVTSHLEHGDAAAVIVRLAASLGVDVIVMGNRGVDASGRYVRSSVPDAVLYTAPCDVLIVATA